MSLLTRLYRNAKDAVTTGFAATGFAATGSAATGSAATGSAAPNSKTAGFGAHFYLPDLCSIQALLPLILIGELLALVLTLAGSQMPYFNWPHFSLLSTEILWIVLCGSALLCRLRPWLDRINASQGAVLCYVTLLLVISVISAGGQILLTQLGPDWHIGLWTVIQHVAVGGIIAGLVLRYVYLQQQLHLQQQTQMQTQMQARFQALQSRIRPHFLFNSMNIIASLIDSDPEMAEQVVEDLSALFRASLSDVEDLVPLSAEIALCERYIHIEQLRLGDRLQVQWQKNLHSINHAVPSLCLQPLLENAIYHGIQPLLDGGTIVIQLSDVQLNDQNTRLSVRISNPYTQDSALHKTGNGMALENLEQRLHAHYGAAAQFSVQRDNAQFVVAFSMATTASHGERG
jgi:two-component system sensor histidine kinase AlgZ